MAVTILKRHTIAELTEDMHEVVVVGEVIAVEVHVSAGGRTR